MNKLEQARDIVLNYDYPEGALSECSNELSEDGFIFNGALYDQPFEVTPQKLAKSLVHHIGIESSNSEEGKIPLGSSKFFGWPHLPKTMDWPEGYDFYAQLYFGEIKTYDAEDIFPDTGVLYLFYNMNSFTGKVIYFNGPMEDLVLKENPKKIKTTPETFKFYNRFTFHFYNANAILPKVLAPIAEKITNTTGIYTAVGTRVQNVKISGKATFYQGEDEYYYEDEENLEFNPYERTLLLENEFGEGNIHFWILTEDLKQRNFDNIQITYSGT
jgi:uncharacterized protein YwqG